jgi:hypothetical protein
MIAREEKLHGLKILKQLFQAPVIEELGRPATSTRDQLNGAVIGYAVGVSRNGVDSFLGVEHRQQAGVRPQHAAQPVDHGLQERSRKKLERIPHQRAIEVLFRKREHVVEELRYL